MQPIELVYKFLLLGTLLTFTTLAGCGKSTNAAGEQSGNGTTSVAAAPKLDPRVQGMADEHAKGMEADALKRAAAMKKLSAH